MKANWGLLTGICIHDNIPSTERAMFRIGVLHLDHTSYAENVITLQSNRFVRYGEAHRAEVIVQLWDNADYLV